MTYNKTHVVMVLLAIIFITFSCKKDVITPTEPEPEEELPEITVFNPHSKIALFDLTTLKDPLDNARNLYSARHILNVSGVPFVETSDIPTAINASIIFISSPIEAGSFSQQDIESLTKWVEGGGVIISPVCKDESLQTLFGFSGSPNYHKNRYTMDWAESSNPELTYFDHENEKTISLGEDNGGNNVIKSYGYALGESSKALATFDSDEVAVIRNTKGKGRTYLFGLEWRDVIQRPQLNRDFEAERVYSNGFEPSADVFPLFVRSVWNDIQSVSAWKYTVPNGYKTVLIPTHDVDATTGYDSMIYMSEYEKTANIKGHYFITTRYIADDIAKPYYIDRTIKLAKDLLKNGHSLGSHSVGHFPDLSDDDKFPLGSINVTRDSYSPQYINGGTVGGTTFGEIKVSKDLIDSDFGINVKSFRSGHLLTNSFLTEALSKSGYSYSSCFTACDLLTGFPFFERIGQDWSGELTSVLQIPIHVSDVFSGDKMTVDNYTQKVDIWADIVTQHKNNYTPCIVLVHPNREWKMLAMKGLVDKVNKTDYGIYNFDDYGAFWIARNNFEFEFDYQEDEEQLIIRVSSDNIRKAASIGVMVETKLPIKNFRLIDNDFKDYPISVTSFGGGKNLVVIK